VMWHGDQIRGTGSRAKPRGLSWVIVVVAAMGLLGYAARTAEGLEVTLVLNTPDKHQVTGTLKEVGEDGAITLIGIYGEQTYTRSQYLTATCPEPAEQALAKQSYLKGEYAKALLLYQQVHEKYRELGWGAASLEGMGKCHLQMRDVEKAIESYSRLLEEYPGYTGTRAVKFSLAQACEVRGRLSWAVDLYGQVAIESDDELSAMSLRNIGNIHYGRKKYKDALLNYLRVAILYQSFPRAPVAESMFRAGDCFEKLAEEEKSPQVAARLRDRAKKYYEDLMTRFPQSDFARQAQLRYQQLTGGTPTSKSSLGEKPSAAAGG